MRLTGRLLVGPMLVGLLFGCDANRAPQPRADHDGRRSGEKTAESPPNAAPAMTPLSPAAPPHGQAPSPSLVGVVLETMDSGGYTYVRIKAKAGDVWAAAPRTAVAVGDTVELYSAMPMHDFPSKTLNRTFKYILFASKAVVVGKPDSSSTQPSKTMPPKAVPAGKMPAGHPPIGGVQRNPAGHPAAKAGQIAVKPGDIEKLAGGYTVAELFAAKAELVGQPVRIRALVVKARRNIMGKNWMHIQDGTGEAGSNDVTVTSTEAFAPVGTIVVVEGTLRADKNIGAGYVFAVLIEGAKVTPEAGSAND